MIKIRIPSNFHCGTSVLPVSLPHKRLEEGKENRLNSPRKYPGCACWPSHWPRSARLALCTGSRWSRYPQGPWRLWPPVGPGPRLTSTRARGRQRQRSPRNPAAERGSTEDGKRERGRQRGQARRRERMREREAKTLASHRSSPGIWDCIVGHTPGREILHFLHSPAWAQSWSPCRRACSPDRPTEPACSTKRQAQRLLQRTPPRTQSPLSNGSRPLCGCIVWCCPPQEPPGLTC